MPLPLPHLDNRRWADLVDEGRSLIPQYAPEWTDHNASDPGITLMELLAYQVEQLIYRLNQIPERHRRKFLQLVGYLPQPPHAAQGVLKLELKPLQPALPLPAGLIFSGRIPLTGAQPSTAALFRMAAPLLVTPAKILTVQVFDGSAWKDQTPTWRERESFLLWGYNPAPVSQTERQPAFYIGFDQSLPVGKEVTLWVELSGAGGRARLVAETAEAEAACRPLNAGWDCSPTSDALGASMTEKAPHVPPHHSVRTAWDYYDGSAWKTLDVTAGQVQDDTRSLTLCGRLQVNLPTSMGSTVVGASKLTAFYLRCRLVTGLPDAAPRLSALFINAAEIEQAETARFPYFIVQGITPPAGQEPIVGQVGKLNLMLNGDGMITGLAFGPGAAGPEVLVEEYQAAGASAAGKLTITLVLAGVSNGAPLQEWDLTGEAVEGGLLRLWTLEPGGWSEWFQRPDLDSAGPEEQVFMLDSASGVMRFGDGLRGRIPPKGAAVLGAYRTTAGKNGNLPADSLWLFAGADDLMNQALLGANFNATVNGLGSITNPVPLSGGADEEEIAHAAGRAAEALYAHERLVELIEAYQVNTLDQIDPKVKASLAAPGRAVTLIDYERLAGAAPGTRVARCRAWAGLDPNYPCFETPGTISVVILPELPLGRPAPTEGLLQVVRAFLARRRLVGTRLVVAGPQYLEVRVQAKVHLLAGANVTRVQTQMIDALNKFLDPLMGGPQGLGWPFGRDVYRSEILQVLDGVQGVDHVLDLQLIPGQGEAQCGNLCVNPMGLVTPGMHKIEVE